MKAVLASIALALPALAAPASDGLPIVGGLLGILPGAGHGNGGVPSGTGSHPRPTGRSSPGPGAPGAPRYGQGSGDSLGNFIAAYALAVDGKNETLLASLFAPGAVATYTSPDQTVTGNTAIAKHDLQAFSGLNTFHNLVPMSVRFTGPNNSGAVAAITYFTATIFGKDCYNGQIVTAQGSYTDSIENTNGTWAITKRAQTYANPTDPYIGNVAIVLGPACNSTGST